MVSKSSEDLVQTTEEIKVYMEREKNIKHVVEEPRTSEMIVPAGNSEEATEQEL